MIYADKTFYQNMFLKGRPAVVPLDQFDGWALEASQQIDMHTFNRLVGVDAIPDEVKMCTCSLAELYFRDAQASGEGVKTSESVGGYSVSYQTHKRTQDEFDASVRAVMFKWLGNTGLLYRGVG